jgi:hypothetical protein
MSTLSEKVGKALYAKLNVSAVTNLATGGVFQDEAPESASFPYVLFTRFTPRDTFRTFGLTLAFEDDLWLVKALTDLDSSTAYSPRELGQLILAECEAAIGSSLTLTGGSETVGVYRERDIPSFREPQSDRRVWSQGFLLRVVAKP